MNEHSCCFSLVLAFFPAKLEVAGLVVVVAVPDLDGVAVVGIGDDMLQSADLCLSTDLQVVACHLDFSSKVFTFAAACCWRDKSLFCCCLLVCTVIAFRYTEKFCF